MTKRKANLKIRSAAVTARSLPTSETQLTARARVDEPTTDQLHRALATATIAFHEALARRIGMSAAEQKVYGALAQLGVATPSQLVKASGLTSGAITGIVDRLERAGYARREPNPGDRRSLLVRPLQTEKVGRLQVPHFQSLGAAMAKLTTRYTPEELVRIRSYLSDTAEVLRKETERLEATAVPSG
jgi:DNA-binding MarR family transcriptional regulator